MISRFPLTVLVLFAASAWALFLAGHGWVIPSSFFSPISGVVGVLSLALLAFDRWLWRARWIREVVGRPVLLGTWSGTLQTTWLDTDGKTPDPIPVFLVVTQTFSDLHVRMLTAESESLTMSVAVTQQPDERFEIAGLYRNTPRLGHRDRSPIHHGGLHLAVAGLDGQRLEGQYWTDRRTAGTLTLKRISTERAPDFQSALELLGRAPQHRVIAAQPVLVGLSTADTGTPQEPTVAQLPPTQSGSGR